MQKLFLFILLIVITFLYGCDPSGGPVIINIFDYHVKVTIMFVNDNQITKKQVVLQPGVPYHPGARNKKQRRIIGLIVVNEQNVELLNVSKDEIETLFVSQKGDVIFFLGKNGIRLEHN